MLKVLTVITGTYHMQKNHIFINSQWQWINKEKRGEKIKGLIERKILQSPLHSKEIKPAHPKGNQPWKCIGRTDAEAETPILWPSDVKSRLIGKDPEAGKDWGQEEKGVTEDVMVGWHHWFQWTWVWVNSGCWWWTWRPDGLQSMGLQRRTWLSDWTELNQFQCLTNQTDWFYIFLSKRRYNSLLFSLGKKEGITHTK